MRRSKYGAVRTEVDGVTFASKREAKRYWELRQLEKKGEIAELEIQPKYPLYAPEGTPYGHVLLGHYIADFRYREKGGLIVEDSKGFRTPLYKWKKKHVEAQYGIQIREV